MLEPMSPCLGCKERYIGCHDRCDAYLEYKKLLAEYKCEINKAKQLDAELNEVSKQRFEKYLRNKKRHQKEGAYN